MKDRFIRIIQPITLSGIILLDCASLLLLFISIKRISQTVSFYTVSFLIIDLIVIAVSAITTAKIFRNGVKFSEKSLEFTGLDSNNAFPYSDIISAETHKDTSPSFKKNYVQRYSSIILHLRDKSVVTIELGYTSKKKLDEILDEINKHI